MRNEARQAEPGAGEERLAEMLDSVDYTANAIQNVKTTIEAVNAKFPDCMPMYFLDGPGNFRDEIATIKKYKGNRDTSHKPKYYNEIRDWMVAHGATLVPEIEVDDLIGISQWGAGIGTTCIISSDKDMDQIPGLHYDWTKSRLFDVSFQEADLMLFYQMLVGDTSDNIPGIDQIGPVRAAALLQECNYDLDRVREDVKRQYQKQYGEGWELAYQEIGRLLYILRDRSHRDLGCPLL